MHKLQLNSGWNDLRPVFEAWSGHYSALVQSDPSGLILNERQSCQMFDCGIAVVWSNMRSLLRLWNSINPTEATLSLFSEVKLKADGRSRMAHPTALLGLTLDGFGRKLWNLISRWAKRLEGHWGSTWGSLCVWPALLSSWAWCSVPEPCAWSHEGSDGHCWLSRFLLQGLYCLGFWELVTFNSSWKFHRRTYSSIVWQLVILEI